MYSRKNLPPFSAEDCPDIKRMGNDGNYYISENRSGKFKWYKMDISEYNDYEKFSKYIKQNDMKNLKEILVYTNISLVYKPLAYL